MMASVQLCASLMICDDPVYFRALGYLGDNRVRGSEAQKVSCPWDRDLGIIPSVSWSQGCVTKQSSFKRALLLRTCTSHKHGTVWVAGTAAEQLRAREGVGVGVGGMDPVLIWLKIQCNKENLESPWSHWSPSSSLFTPNEGTTEALRSPLGMGPAVFWRQTTWLTALLCTYVHVPTPQYI